MDRWAKRAQKSWFMLLTSVQNGLKRDLHCIAYCQTAGFSKEILRNSWVILEVLSPANSRIVYHCYHCIISTMQTNLVNYRKFSAARSFPNNFSSYYFRKFSEDGNLRVKSYYETEVLELPAFSFQTAHNWTEVAVFSAKHLECRGRDAKHRYRDPLS